MTETALDPNYTLYWQRTVIICQLKRNIGKNIFEIGKYLYEVKSDYDVLPQDICEAQYGHPTWKSYLAAPENSGGVDMLPQFANRSIRLYQKYCLELGLQKQTVSGEQYCFETLVGAYDY